MCRQFERYQNNMVAIIKYLQQSCHQKFDIGARLLMMSHEKYHAFPKIFCLVCHNCSTPPIFCVTTFMDEPKEQKILPHPNFQKKHILNSVIWLQYVTFLEICKKNILQLTAHADNWVHISTTMKNLNFSQKKINDLFFLYVKWKIIFRFCSL